MCSLKEVSLFKSMDVPTVETLLGNAELLHIVCKESDPNEDWRKLVEYFNKTYNDINISSESLEKFVGGGGSSAREVLEILKTTNPDLTIDEFKKAAAASSFRNIEDVLANYVKTQRLSKISLNTREILEDSMNFGPRSNAMMPWEKLARHFNIDDTTIQNIQSRISAPGEYSPTKKLFQEIKRQSPNMPLEFIKEAISPSVWDKIRNVYPTREEQIGNDDDDARADDVGNRAGENEEILHPRMGEEPGDLC